MKVLISLVLFGSAIAEWYRLPILLSNGISFVDLFACFSFFVGLIWIFFNRNKIQYPVGYNFFIGFLFVSFISLLINSGDLGLQFGEILNSFFYLFRFIVLSFLGFITFNLNDKDKKFILMMLFITSFIILMFGFWQLKNYSDFDSMNMADIGWDPHIGRMLSTWFDPNFLGGYFAFIISLGIGIIFENYKKSKRLSLLIGVLILFLFVGIILTYSRSALLALMVSLFVIGLFLSRKLLIIGFILAVFAISFSPRMQERFISGIESAKALFIPSQYALDPTAQLRIDSWNAGLQIYKDNPIIGIGFNTLGVVQKSYWGFVKSHAANGIDSSILTVMAITGTVGLIFFLLFILSVLKVSLYNFTRYKDGYSIGLFSGVCGILIHSIFVNSLFFYAFIPSLFIAIGLLGVSFKGHSSLSKI